MECIFTLNSISVTLKIGQPHMIKLSMFIRSWRASESQKSIYFCFIDYVKDFDCVDHKQLCKIFQEMGIPNHLTCLLRNLYAGQEATVRTVLKFDRKQ